MSLHSLRLNGLDRISPSRFSQIDQCPLREVWQASGTPPLLPVSPAARLGVAAHKMLELATRGDVEDLERAWEDCVRKIENEMQQIGDSGLVPLRDTARYYEVKKRHAFATARKVIVTSKARGGPQGSGINAILGNEVWLESTDGLVGGFVDKIVASAGGVEILDYKTGVVTEDNAGVVKEAYEIQLLLYAALYYEVTGEWPVKLTVSTMAGIQNDVPVDTERALQLLAEAKSTLQEVNARINNGCSQEQLAKPSPKACVLCTYRPACNRYWAERSPAAPWPADTRGLVQGVTQLGNGTLRVVIQDTTGAVTVRGLSRDRFAFLNRKPLTVMFCNLRRDKVAGLYRQSRLTVGYALES